MCLSGDYYRKEHRLCVCKLGFHSVCLVYTVDNRVLRTSTVNRGNLQKNNSSEQTVFMGNNRFVDGLFSSFFKATFFFRCFANTRNLDVSFHQ